VPLSPSFLVSDAWCVCRLLRSGLTRPCPPSSALFPYTTLFRSQNRQKAAPLGTPPVDIFLNEYAVLRKWAQPEAVYLIVEQSRADYWKQLLTSRFHVYHQIITSGMYVVLSNQL